jgi:peroxiredoxin
MQHDFLESDYLFKKRIAVFGINHIPSSPTISHLKDINLHYNKFIARGCDEVWCVSFGDFAMFEFLMPKFSNSIRFIQNNNSLKFFQSLLKKKGHVDFLQDYWQFACVINSGQVECYLDQPFEKPIPIDTHANIYSCVTPGNLLNQLK